MPALSLTYGPHPIFSRTAKKVEVVDDECRELIDDMFDLLERENGVGMAAPMAGIDRRIIIVNWINEGHTIKFAMINPEITSQSEKTQEFNEGSLSFPGIAAKVTRPAKIEVAYLDGQGESQTMKADGFLATIIQHEIDYLNGIIYLDYLSKIKRERLVKKTVKFQKQNNIHGENCGCC